MSKPDELLKPDLIAVHRAPEGYYTEARVHWTPNGFVLDVRDIKALPDQGCIEGQKAMAVTLSYTLRKNRKALPSTKKK